MTRGRTSLGRLGLLLAGVAAAVVAAALATGFAAAGAPGPIEIEIRYSRFTPSRIQVPVGVPVTFVLRNADPIDHEWIVGDPASHERHRSGTEPVHDARPTEVSIAALDIVRTTVTFTEPGELLFICHLPGHEAYGMVGTVVVGR
jgi:uncharacterized cupredoxin-like copper-binding protein